MAAILILAGISGAQVSWQTTHTNNGSGGYASGGCVLASASVRVRVNPGFLDVEEDVEIGTVGSAGLGNDAKSLEIVGSFGLPLGSAITGALLWDGERVLQGKLLDRGIADSLYEDLVDRNSKPPVRPRDPLIVERLPSGIYRFRIYPVALGFTRHMRLRYQLPPVTGADGLQFPFKAAVSSQFSGSTLQVPVTLENGGASPKIIFATAGGVRTEMTLPRTRLLTPGEISNAGNTWDIWGNLQAPPDIAILPLAAARQASFKTTFAGGQMAGNYLNLYATVSPEVLKGLSIRNAASLVVVVSNAKRAYDLPVGCPGDLAVGCGSVYFNGKSDAVWGDTLLWEAYDAAGKLLSSARVKSTAFETAQDTGIAVLWAASESHFSEKKELPLGPVFGFVDAWASILSLPGDSLAPAQTAFYSQNGVPRIANQDVKDVIPNYEEGAVPNQVPTALAASKGPLGDPASWRVERSQGGLTVRIQGLAQGLDAVIELFDLQGKSAGHWKLRSESGSLNLASLAARPGIYLLKVRVAGRLSVKRIVL